MSIDTPQIRRTRSAVRVLFIRVLLCLCLLVGAALTSVYLLCVFKPELVTSTVQEQLCAATGMPWQIRGGIVPVLDPFPGIIVSDVRILSVSADQIAQAEPTLPLAQVKTARLYPDVSSLWRLSLNFRLIELVEPTINLAYDNQGRPIWLPLPQGCGVPGADVPPAPPGLDASPLPCAPRSGVTEPGAVGPGASSQAAPTPPASAALSATAPASTASNAVAPSPAVSNSTAPGPAARNATIPTSAPGEGAGGGGTSGTRTPNLTRMKRLL